MIFIINNLQNFLGFSFQLLILVLLILLIIDIILFVVIKSFQYIIESIYSINQYNIVLKVLHNFKHNQFGDYMRFVNKVDHRGDKNQ